MRQRKRPECSGLFLFSDINDVFDHENDVVPLFFIKQSPEMKKVLLLRSQIRIFIRIREKLSHGYAQCIANPLYGVKREREDWCFDIFEKADWEIPVSWDKRYLLM